ncbi:ABC transporter substrate-binding protein [Glycomyces sp. NPDC021274]|uniref:ABC transporter substrate-binding protein n=1 Tax=Glycomyces sp. NPDC021274 TaxID=3155120 RepID=UPI0033F9536B
MTKRRHLPALFATAALATAAGCTDDEAPEVGRYANGDLPRGETLYSTGTAWGPPGDFNPISAGEVTGLNGLGYEHLFIFDTVEQRIVPWLAEAGEWIAEREFRVQLRSGVKWSDGKPLTAEDVVFTFELGKIDGVPYANIWDWLDSAEAVDELTVLFRFSEARQQEWDNFLYTNEIVPKHVFEAYTQEELLTGPLDPNPVVTGPYSVHSFDETQVTWVKRDGWWATEALGLEVQPRYIVDFVTTGHAEILNLLIEGRIDLANNFMPGIDDFLKGEPELSTFYDKPPFMAPVNTAMLIPNTTRQPLDDPEFRRAMAYAISPGEIVDEVYGGMVSEAHPTGLLPIWERYYDAEAVSRHGFVFEPYTALDLLAAAGYKDEDGDGFVETLDGEPIALQLVVPAGWTDWEDAATAIARDLNDVGINVTTSFIEAAEVDAVRVNGDFDMLINNASGVTNSPWSHFQYLFELPVRDDQNRANFSRWEDEHAWELTQELSTLPSDDPRYPEVIAELQVIAMRDLPAIPIWYNGAWSQACNAVWTGWPSGDSAAPGVYPSFWGHMWGLGSVRLLTEIRRAE